MEPTKDANFRPKMVFRKFNAADNTFEFEYEDEIDEIETSEDISKIERIIRESTQFI
jgi:hypothetical protein